MIYLDLTFNLTLLIALSIVSGFIENRWAGHVRLRALLQGILFGGASVLGMLRPLSLGPGIIVDGRSIMISLCALFFGPWAAMAAVMISLPCRIWLGGTGVISGALLILVSAGVGLLAHFRLRPEANPPSTEKLYLFGLAVHAATLATMFALPKGIGLNVLKHIGLPVILMFPLATILAGKILSDQFETKRAQEALANSEAKMRSILDNIDIGVSLISPKMKILDLNRRMREWFPAVDSSQHPICHHAFNNPPSEEVCDCCPTRKTLRDGLVHEATIQKPHASALHNYRIVSSPILNASGEITAAIEIFEDITEKISLERQLQQARKMEAIGRLAGGIAHDFNNMLAVIIGYAELALADLEPGQPLLDNLQRIKTAAEHSADLTRQLLAFARRQTVVPRLLDLNETVEGMLKMLWRLIGENVDLAWLPTEVWPIKMDPSQINQILTNLCVNARDAIKGVGKITIETSGITFDETYCAGHTGFIPGDYVMLAVSDDGDGMDKETMDKIFEPFFTTKESGIGTGLGLATVYGIVKQNNGFINVYSERGHGSVFKLYLPRHAAETETVQKESEALPVALGHETILLVEDNPAMLGIGRLMLEKFGYHVLVASTPGDAIHVARSHEGEIHLLITDVIMPEMNGLDLSGDLASIYPGLKCLFMSGYTGDIIARHGFLDKGINFIQKPFSKKQLAVKVREVLDSN